MQRLQGKRVLITGGSSGIGQAIAIAYAKEGAQLVLSYRVNHIGVENTLNQIRALGGFAIALQADLQETLETHRLFQAAIEHLGGIDILVNNAGTLTRHDGFLDIPLDVFQRIQAVNLQSPFILMQEAAKKMQAQETGGCIINISSKSADITTPGLAHYECSKAALHALTRGAASDLARYQIRINAIAPGLVATDINKEQRKHVPEVWRKRSSQIPLGRVGLPADIASLAVFLVLDEAAWITGSIIPIDGGLGVASPFAQ